MGLSARAVGRQSGWRNERKKKGVGEGRRGRPTGAATTLPVARGGGSGVERGVLVERK